MASNIYTIHAKKLMLETELGLIPNPSDLETWGHSTGISWTLAEMKVAEIKPNRPIDPDNSLLMKVYEHYQTVKSGESRALKSGVLPDDWYIKYADIKPLADCLLNLRRFALIQPAVIRELLARIATLDGLPKDDLALWLLTKSMGYSSSEIQKLLDTNDELGQDFYLKSAREVYSTLGYGRMSGLQHYQKLLKDFDQTKLKSPVSEKENYLAKLRSRKIKTK